MKKNKFLTILFGLGTKLYIPLIGKLMFSEIVALLYLPFINYKNLFKQNEQLKYILRYLLIILLGLVLSDLINRSDPVDYLRGWALIIFSIISIFFLTDLFNRSQKNLILLLLFVAVANLVFSDTEFDLQLLQETPNYFKSNIDVVLNPIIMILGFILFKKRFIKTLISLFFLYTIVCFVYNARSNGLIYFVSAGLIIFRYYHLKLTTFTKVVVAILVLGITYLTYVYYVQEVLDKGLGGSSNVGQFSLTKNPYDPFELLYYGRTDFFILITAIQDNPLFGYGSWGKDQNDQYAKLKLSILESKYRNFKGYISAHSVLLGAWVYGGLIGFIGSLFLFLKLFKSFVQIYISKNLSDYFPIIVVLGVDMLWGYLFSPIGILRTSFPIFAAFIINEFNFVKNKKS